MPTNCNKKYYTRIEINGLLGPTTRDQEVMTSVGNSIQSPYGAIPNPQSSKIHAVAFHQPENRNRDATAVMPGMANLIDTDADHEEQDRKHKTYSPPLGIEDI